MTATGNEAALTTAERKFSHSLNVIRHQMRSSQSILGHDHQNVIPDERLSFASVDRRATCFQRGSGTNHSIQAGRALT